MRNLRRTPSQKGFGLLEVLITVVVLAITLVALAGLQALLLQGGAYAKARSVALNLAQAKLEDLRGFTELELPTSSSGIFTYQEIGSNTGGAENMDGTLVNPGSSSMTVSDVTYGQAWTVVSYYYCGANQSPSTSNCGSAKPYPDFKVVTVRVTWTDPIDPGSTQSVELESTISATDPVGWIVH